MLDPAAGIRKLRANLLEADQMYMVLVAVAIGLLGGLGAVGFRLLIKAMNHSFWHQGTYTIDYIRSLPFWWKLAAPAAGGVVVGFIVHYFAKEAKGHGVPEVMEAVALRGGRIRPRVVVAKLAASAICIGSGGSVGREGPIVQIGSALGSAIGQWLHVSQARLRTLVACGAAAGIAGTFNAPVGGALFAVEIILGDFGVAQFSPIVISSVAATVVSQHFLGDFPAFVVPRYQHASAQELLIFAVLGVFAGLAALGFVRTLYKFEDVFDAVRLPLPVKGLIGGIMIGAIALGFPQIFGVGYEAIENALAGHMVWYFMLLLVAAKILAVSITIGSGGSGGIFAPSLFIGAMLGGSVGSIAHALWPASTTTPGAYALVGMGAVVAAGTHAPITAIIIIFEMTNDYKIILPLMITCIIATLLATRLQSASIYTLKLLRRGIDIHRGRAVNVLAAIKVRDVMKRDPATVSPRDNLGMILSRFVEHAGTTLFVVEADRTLKGVITIDELRPILRNQGTLEGLLIAQDVMVWGKHPTASAADSLSDVMRHLGTYRGEVPVLENGRLAGVIWPKDVIESYNTEIFKRDMARSMASSISPASRPEPVPTVADTVVTEMPVPRRFVGKSIQELEVRRKYGVSILMVKRAGEGDHQVEASPDAAYVFQEDDVMLIMGSQESLESLRR